MATRDLKGVALSQPERPRTLQSRGYPVETGDPALYGRVAHGFGDPLVHVRVEGVGDELDPGGELGDDGGGGELHLRVDLLGAGEQGAAEDAGVAEHVVHALPVGGEGGARREGVLRLDLGVGVRERQDHLPLPHRLRLYEARHARRRHDDVGLAHDGLHVHDLDALRAGALVGERVRVGAEHLLRPRVHHEGGYPEPGGPEPDLPDNLILQPQAGMPAGHQRRAERDDGRAVDVVVHNGLGQGLYQASLDLEALRRRDVLEVDASEAWRYAHHGLHELVHVLRIYEDRHSRDAGELVVEDGLALHHRHRGYRPDVPEAKDPRAVRADRDAAPDHGQLACERVILGDGLARPRHPGRVHVAHVLHRPDRPG